MRLRLPIFRASLLAAVLGLVPLCVAAQEVPRNATAASPTPPVPAATALTTAAPADPAPAEVPDASSRQRSGAQAFIGFQFMPLEYVDNYLTRGFGAYAAPSVVVGSTFPIHGTATAIELAGEFRTETYAHQTGVVPTAGGGTLLIPALLAHDYTQDFRLGVRVAKPQVFVGIGDFYRAGSYGFPELIGLGFGVEALPDLSRSHSVYGRIYYYPNVNNEDSFSDTASGRPLGIRYTIVRYQAGAAKRLGRSNGFFTVAADGIRYFRIKDAPSNDGRIGLNVGYALKF